MSMHKKPLTQSEEDGLRAHGLDIGTPSQLSDCFRFGMAWQAALSPSPVPVEAEAVRKAAWDLAQKVRHDLDRKSCPDAFMRIAFESVEKHYTAPPATEAKPMGYVGIVPRFVEGVGRVDDAVGVNICADRSELKDGDPVYLHPPKPAPLPQADVYRCHKCNLVTPPPKPFSLYVTCSCGALTAATIASDLAPLPQGLKEAISNVLNRHGDITAELSQDLNATIGAWMAGKALVPVEFIEVLDNAPYINPSNYDHDQVCDLNTAVREALAMLPQGASE